MELKDIKTIGVMGAGVMGGGIAQTMILAGFNVIVRDLKDEILVNTKNTIVSGRFGLKGGVERGKQTQAEMDAALARLTLTTKVEDLKNVDYLLEAIGGGGGRELENKDLKLRVFAEMDKIVKKEAIFASNTSMFTIADLAKSVQRKDRFLGMHWFSRGENNL
jgi:3-hydroxybutyryl-CoA dehydrogenase